MTASKRFQLILTLSALISIEGQVLGPTQQGVASFYGGPQVLGLYFASIRVCRSLNGSEKKSQIFHMQFSY